MPHCPNLLTLYADRFRIRHEEGRKARQGDDPWQLVIPCDHGEIYVHGQDMLGAATSRRGRYAKKLTALPCARVTQDGSDGVNAVFHLDDFETVAALMKPKRRRSLSADQRERLILSGRASIFPSDPGANRGFKEPGLAPTEADDQEAA